MGLYRAFGLDIASEIQLPSLPAVDAEVSRGAPAITIRLGAVAQIGLNEANSIGLFAQAITNQFWLQVPEIARFHVANGDTITVMPEAGADEQSIRLYLLGSCLAAIAHQRGQLVLHGCALRFGDHAVVFCGNSGNGKSTLAAALHQRGYEVLSDDLAVIDRHCRLQPGYPQLKLWRDTANKLNIDIKALKRIRLQVDKYAYPLTNGFCDTALPVGAVYVLNTHNKKDFLCAPLNGFEKFNPLKNQTYRFKQVQGLGLKAEHLKLCTQLASRITVTRLTRPSGSFDTDKLIELIETDLKAAGLLTGAAA